MTVENKMPEGPEVRRNAEQLKTALRWTQIKGVSVTSGRYTKKPIADLGSLCDRNIETVGSKGKLIFIALDDKRYIHSTLGMAGFWSAEPTKYARIFIQTANSKTAGPHFNDPRNFGTFKVVSEDEHLAKIDSLGHDFSQDWHTPLEAVVTHVESRLARYGKKQTIAEALLDQRIFCGIGNYLRADALWLAGINPHAQATSLSSELVRRICETSMAVSQAAWDDRSPLEIQDLPYHHLTYYQRQTPFGGKVISEDLGGRTIWWCPAEQTLG
jgi:formamidopyrimidine-DNA glycosylase